MVDQILVLHQRYRATPDPSIMWRTRTWRRVLALGPRDLAVVRKDLTALAEHRVTLLAGNYDVPDPNPAETARKMLHEYRIELGPEEEPSV